MDHLYIHFQKAFSLFVINSYKSVTLEVPQFKVVSSEALISFDFTLLSLLQHPGYGPDAVTVRMEHQIFFFLVYHFPYNTFG